MDKTEEKNIQQYKNPDFLNFFDKQIGKEKIILTQNFSTKISGNYIKFT